MPRRAVRCSKRVRAALGIGGGRGLCARACACVCVRERVCHSAPGSACRAVCDTRAHTALCTLRPTPEASVIAMAGCLHPSTPPPCPSHAWRCQATLVQEASVTKVLVRVTHSGLCRLVREWGGAGRRRPPQLGQQAWRLAHTPGRRHGGQASASEPSASIRKLHQWRPRPMDCRRRACVRDRSKGAVCMRLKCDGHRQGVAPPPPSPLRALRGVFLKVLECCT